MTPKLKVLENVLERLKSVTYPCIGGLYGIMYERTLLVVGMNVNTSGTNDVEPFLEMQLKYPTGVDFCGFVSFYNKVCLQPESFKEYLREVLVTDNPVVFLQNVDSFEMNTFMFRNDRSVETIYTVMSQEEFSGTFITMQIHSSLLLCTNTEKRRISRAVETLQKMVSCGGTIFHFNRTDVYVYGIDIINEYEEDVRTLGDIYDFATLRKDGRLKQGIVEVSMFVQTAYTLFEDPQTYAPYIVSSVSKSNKLVMMLPIDTLCLAERSRVAKNSYGLLVDAVCRSISLFQTHLLKLLGSPEEICDLQHQHFFPNLIGHSITLVYSQNSSDDDLREERLNLHEQLCLPVDSPVFRKGNALVLELPSSGLEKSPLLNVHVGVKESGVVGGTVSIVEGFYNYYHYLQGNINDNGWGCAYRSFQTLFSWFRWQGYTTQKIPSHDEIQECLVRIKDKPQNFIGSHNWIGSTEVGFCLDAMLGITSRIISVPSGSDLHTKGNELLYHFQIQKTPVMIGGGVLAHTILGIHYNQDTGHIKFLILDPHYIGPEDIDNIQRKGWIGWKGKEFWNRRSFYNMCLPQRPQTL